MKWLGFVGLALVAATGVASLLAAEPILRQQYLHYGLYHSAADAICQQLNVSLSVGLLGVLLAALVLRGRARSWIERVHRAWAIPGALAGAAVLALNGYAYLGHALAGAERPNVILIGIDTLRADHLGVYGYHRNTSPNIDAWAKQATVFERCITSIPRTTQSLASIMTARYPFRTGVRHLGDRLPDAQLTLAEILSDAGYHTIQVVATGIPEKKLDQGFDVVVDTDREFSAKQTVDKAVAELSRVDAPYMLFAFFRDPHIPYAPPELIFDRSYRGPFANRLNHKPNKAKAVFQNSLAPRTRHHAIALYDSEIHSLDRQFKRLLDAVKSKSEDNIIILFADHGESLGEHSYYFDHGDLLYQPGLHIPFIVEGIELGASPVTGVVRSVDLVPTLLAALDIEVDNNQFDGVDLATNEAELEAYSESGQVLIDTAFETGRRFVRGLRGRLRSVVSGDTKIIYIPKQDGSYDLEVYDLARDPRELDDEAGRAEVGDLTRKLLEWVEQDRPNWQQADPVLSKEDEERLRSLGYL